MAPGSTWSPRASSVSREGGIAACAPTATTTPSLTATLASMTQSGVTTLPPLMTRSAEVMIALSQHRPAAVDRKIDAGDLARGIARQEQAGIGDVDVARHALERIVGGVALGRFVDGDAEALRHVGTNLVAEARPVDHAGRDAIDVDVVGADLERKALGDAAQPPLGGGIGHAAGAPAHSERAADIDDLAVALGHHGRQHAAHGVKAAVHVERDDVVEFLRRRFHAGLADRPRAAGDVDQNVDAAIGALRRRGHVLALPRIGEVAGHDDRLAAAGRHLRRHRLDGAGVAADQGEPRALPRKGHGDRRAHALGRPGDHRHTPFEPQVHGRGTVGVQNSFFGRSSAGGRNAPVKISSTAGVRGSALASTRMSIDFLSRTGSTLPSSILAISGWFISSLRVASQRSRSTGTLISGSRLAPAATDASISLSESRRPLLMARTRPRTASGFSFTSFFETMMALE